MRRLLLLASSLWALPALAQTPGSCKTGTAQAFLDVSDVQASLFNTGALFYGGSTTSGDGYLVPKETGNSPIFAASLWIGGKVGGEVRALWARYGRWQMWPGPLDDGATLPDPTDCSAYDRIWTVSTYDLAIYEQTGVASADLAEWPIGLGAPAVDADGQPVVATARDQTVALAQGERPVVSGTQTAFWVMNDVGNAHVGFRRGANEYTQVEENPLGVEVAVTAASLVAEDDALNQGTFYRYRVTNRNALPITDAFLGFYVDPDLGDAGDDYVGVDTTRGLNFVYNAGSEDGVYGSPPPAAGFDLLDGLGSFMFLGDLYYPCVTGSWSQAVYNNLQGIWGGGVPVTASGYGCQTDAPPTRFAFPGDPVTGAFWSERNADGTGRRNGFGDRSTVFGSPRFDLQPGESRTFGLAVLFAQGTDHLDSITQLRAASDRVQAAYDEGSLFEATATTPLLATPEPTRPSGDGVLRDSLVAFEWAPVADAQRYRIEVSRSESFADTTVFLVARSAAEVRLPDEIVGNAPETYLWRVRAESVLRRSPYSEVRSFSYYRYVPRPLNLPSGAPAVVEVVGPGGIDPCGPQALTTVGCDVVDGHAVFGVPNSTGIFLLNPRQSIGEDAARYGPNDFEIRMVDSSFAYAQSATEERLIRVPFQLWDIGVVAPGQDNDPSDDVRLIPWILDPGLVMADPCRLEFSTARAGSLQITSGPARATPRIYGEYPAVSYEVFASDMQVLSVADSNQCPSFSRDDFVSYLRVGSDGRRQIAPIRRIQFVDATADTTATVADLEGVVVRIYTADPLPVADTPRPQLDGLALGPAYPNPAARSLTVPYRLARAGEIRLAVYDVLGREVAVLHDGRQPEGEHAASLDADELAPGVYIVRLRAGEDARSTRITIVR